MGKTSGIVFPFHAGHPPRFAGPVPRQADVVVIGGGVIGVMTAWFLAARGEKVVLCEKGRIAALFTWFNQWKIRRSQLADGISLHWKYRTSRSFRATAWPRLIVPLLRRCTSSRCRRNSSSSPSFT